MHEEILCALRMIDCKLDCLIEAILALASQDLAKIEAVSADVRAKTAQLKAAIAASTKGA